MAEGTLIALSILVSLVIMLLIGLLIYRDMLSRGVDPIPVLILTLVFTPVGLIVWFLKRRQHPPLKPQERPEP